MLKRGSIPVMALTILTIVIFALALISFSITTIKILGKVSDSSSFVTEFAIGKKNVTFLGQGTEFKHESLGKDGFLGMSGENVLQISVQSQAE